MGVLQGLQNLHPPVQIRVSPLLIGPFFPPPQAPSSFEERIVRLYHFRSNWVESTHDFSPNLVQAFVTLWEVINDFLKEIIFGNWGKTGVNYHGY